MRNYRVTNTVSYRVLKKKVSLAVLNPVILIGEKDSIPLINATWFYTFSKAMRQLGGGLGEERKGDKGEEKCSIQKMDCLLSRH